MRKFYAIALVGGLVLGSLSADAGSVKTANLAFRKSRAVEVPVHPAFANTAKAASRTAKETAKTAKDNVARLKAARRVASVAENQVWRPVKQVVSAWDYDTENWIELEEYTTTWDANGNSLVDLVKSLEGDGYSKYEYVYDEYGFNTSKTSYVGASPEALEPATRKTIQYDPVIHNLIVSSTDEMWDAATSSWVARGETYRRIVTRGDDGKVTRVQIEVFYDGRWDPMEKYDFVYGADGKATKIVYSIMEFDMDTYMPVDWAEDVVYDNIEWYDFDGQIYDLDCIYEGANKVKSFTQDVDGDSYVTNVTYVGDTDDFTLVSVMGTDTFTQTWTNHDFGGYTYHNVYSMDTGDGLYTEEEIASIEYDGLGNVLLDVWYMIADGEVSLDAYLAGEETVSPEHGLPLQYTMREFYPLEPEIGGESYNIESRAVGDDILAPLQTLEGDWENFIKIDFSEYTIAQSVAVDRIAADVDGANAEYYTIDGRRISGTPAAGLYIRRTAAGASKVVVK